METDKRIAISRIESIVSQDDTPLVRVIAERINRIQFYSNLLRAIAIIPITAFVFGETQILIDAIEKTSQNPISSWAAAAGLGGTFLCHAYASNFGNEANSLRTALTSHLLAKEEQVTSASEQTASQ